MGHLCAIPIPAAGDGCQLDCIDSVSHGGTYCARGKSASGPAHDIAFASVKAPLCVLVGQPLADESQTRSENLRAKYSRPSKRGYTVVHSAAGDNERASLSSGTREAGESEGSERKRSDLATLFSHRPCLVMLLSYAGKYALPASNTQPFPVERGTYLIVTSPNIMAFQTVFPLFAYTPTGLGGLNLSVSALTGHTIAVY